MREDAQSRLKMLRTDYEQGQARLLHLEQQTAGIRDNLLRIAGAIQILEELLAKEESSTPQHDGAKLAVP